jgi:hypothetical protein
MALEAWAVLVAHGALLQSHVVVRGASVITELFTLAIATRNPQRLAAVQAVRLFRRARPLTALNRRVDSA